MRDHEVAVVVHRPNARFLVLLRSPARGGYWNLVAGGVEPGEPAGDAAARELAEETGLRAAVTPVAVELAYEKPWGRVRLDVFAAEAPAGWEPTLNEEHVTHRWCSEREAIELLAYPEPRAAVHEVARAPGAHA
ncbi:MAG: NUDIX domain-containing protein [Gaiellaceae bacterium]